MVYGFYPKQKAFTETDERDLKKEEEWHNELLGAGFNYNEEYNFYYSEEGALMNDGPYLIEELLKQQRYSEAESRGYFVTYGKPTPQGERRGITRAIYCRNYQRIIDNLDKENDPVKTR